MELGTIKKLIIQGDISKLISGITASREISVDDGFKQFEPENHIINDRKNREVLVPTNRRDSDGNIIQYPDGTPEMKTVYEPVAKITTAAQKQIVEWAVQIAAGVPVEVYAKPEEGNVAEETMLKMLKRTLKDNKMEFLDQEILRLRAIYKICAEIWYLEADDSDMWAKDAPGTKKQRLKLKLLSQETGDELYPVRDSNGKMVALGRGFKIKDEDDKEIDAFEIYFKDYVLLYTQGAGSWSLSKSFKIPFGKANFIVHEQPRTEWEDVQTKIDRLEVLDSNQADQNDATGSPILAITGKVAGFGKRGETGKVFEMEDGGDMKIVESKGAPEAVKFERENLVKGIFDETNTPQISFSEAQGFGANVPGITIKLLFLPATLKAMSKQSGGWGMSVQRRYNFLMAAMVYLNPAVKTALSMEVSPKFSIYMPENTTEKYENIVKLVAAGLVSKQTAIGMLGLVEDVEKEWEAIQKEAAEAATLTQKAAPQPATGNE